jgi:Zn-dependent protease with chaperone function
MTMQRQGPGTYFDGATAASRIVTLTIEDSALAIASADSAPLARWDYSDIESLPAPPDRLRLGLHDGSSTARLDVRDPAFAQAIEEHLGFGTPRHHASERRQRRLVIAWSAAAVAAVLAIGVAGLPAIAELALPLIPHSWEMRAGPLQHQLAIDTFDEEGPFECGDEGDAERAGKAVFTKMFRRLEAAANLPIPIRPFVVRMKEANAGTYPGGYIHVNMGLVLELESPDELGGVIAHELGHVANRDALRKSLHTLGLAYLFGMAIGDVTGGAAIIIAGKMLDYRYSRSQEAAADAFGIAVMNRLGADSHRFSSWFERMMKPGRRDYARIIRTHPLNADRIAAIRAMPRVANPTPLLTDEEWQTLRQVCSRK